MITKNQLTQGCAPERHFKDGSINSVLCLSRHIGEHDITSPWQVSNSIWYNNHVEMYDGFILLEDLAPYNELQRLMGEEHKPKELISAAKE